MNEAGCEIFGNGLIVRSTTRTALAASPGDVLTADEFGVPPGKPVKYLVLGQRRQSLNVEGSGLSQNIVHAVKVTDDSSQSARERTILRREAKVARAEYDSLSARIVDDARVTPSDIDMARTKAENAETMAAVFKISRKTGKK